MKKTKPGYYVPPVTKYYDQELKAEVLKYMEDRYDYLAAGRHPLDDLSRSPYISRLADWFELPWDKVASDFDQLGQKITDEKNQRYLDEQFAGVPEHNVTQEQVDQLFKLREEFHKTRPTKGWATKKMARHRWEYQAKAAKLLGFNVEDTGDTALPIKLEEGKIFFCNVLTEEHRASRMYGNLQANVYLPKSKGFGRDYIFTMIVKDFKLTQVNNKIYKYEDGELLI